MMMSQEQFCTFFNEIVDSHYVYVKTNRLFSDYLLQTNKLQYGASCNGDELLTRFMSLFCASCLTYSKKSRLKQQNNCRSEITQAISRTNIADQQ